ncbi:MAG: hypothetical protein ACI90U_002254 [Pseudomonadales bacterium]|jgi:hypothetical protein
MLRWVAVFLMLVLPYAQAQQIVANGPQVDSLDAQFFSQLDTYSYQKFGNVGGVYSTGKAKPAESLLVGLIIDGTEVGVIHILADDNEYYFPLSTLLPHLGVGARIVGGGLNVSSPGGDVYLERDSLVYTQDLVFVKQSALINKLKLDIEFDESLYAIKVLLPWWSEQDGSGWAVLIFLEAI